jgi:hypothetical protein
MEISFRSGTSWIVVSVITISDFMLFSRWCILEIKNVELQIILFFHFNHFGISVISGFRDVDENCVLLAYYAASSGNSVPTYRDR